jgi:hypothetical protein
MKWTQIAYLSVFLFWPISAVADFRDGADAFILGDYKKAFSEFMPLAKQGDNRAQAGIGRMYYRGDGVSQDYLEAARWFKKSSKGGNAIAQYDLGVMYDKGIGVPQDYRLAIKWWTEAAKQNHSSAQFNLGLAYAKGEDVTQDYIAAYKWANMASVVGSPNAKKLLEILKTRMTSEQLAEGQRLSEELIKKARVADTLAPKINIAASIKVDTDRPTITGTVTAHNSIVQVLVDGTATNFSDNTFSFTPFVPARGSKVIIKVVDEWGNSSAKVVSLTREFSQASSVGLDPLDPTTFFVKNNPNAVALIIGIEDYKRTPSAPYADNDAALFADYARSKLGVPSNNIKLLINDSAGFVDILEAVSDWLPSATRAGLSDVYVFFAGHGLSSSGGEDVFLLPHNGSAKLLEQTALQRSELFDAIARAKPRSVTAFLDTCYSGTTRTDEMLVAQRGVRIVPKEQLIPVGFTVFSAAGMKQTASMLPEAEHGLFSYWLMKGMEGDADSNGDRLITAGELHDYTLANVSRLQRNQTPELQGDAERVLVRW